LELGALMGAIMAGMYTDKYTRQSSILAACSMSHLPSAFSMLIYPFIRFPISRLLHWFSVPVFCPTTQPSIYRTCYRRSRRRRSQVRHFGFVIILFEILCRKYVGSSVYGRNQSP
jgi:hypothetical protein